MWNDIKAGLETHATGGQHKEAAIKLKAMKEPNIAAQMDERLQKKQVENNNQLSYIIKALKFLSNVCMYQSTCMIYCILFHGVRECERCLSMVSLGIT